jgi:hypothetical protein
LTQTQAGYDYTVIIEEGLSYKKFTESLGGKPILIHPDGELTINYLDTQGLPLNQLQIASAVALVSKMIGESPDPEKQQLRQAQIGQYVTSSIPTLSGMGWQTSRPGFPACNGWRAPFTNGAGKDGAWLHLPRSVRRLRDRMERDRRRSPRLLRLLRRRNHPISEGAANRAVPDADRLQRVHARGIPDPFGPDWI